MLHNIPSELRELCQWVAAGPDKQPLNPRTGQAASVTDPNTWGTYEQARHAGYKHIGFVFTESDPYAVIDLDNKPHRPLDTAQVKVHEEILRQFETYTERSQSGRGYHIVCKGKIPAGVNDQGSSIEMYSWGRYMIFTGNVVRQMPIVDCQEGLEYLYGLHKPAATVEVDENNNEVLDDKDLVDMAIRAANGPKFTELCNGDWQTMGYPSQSEADFALLSIFAYYTRDNEQVRRLFRMSNLGKRDKAIRNNDYLNRALGKIRAVQPPPVDISAAFTTFLAQSSQKVEVPIPPQSVSGGSNQGVPNPLPPKEKPEFLGNSLEKYGEQGVPPPQLPGLDVPPGLIGEMALYFYHSSVRPVPEISLAAALALTSGVCGRSYNISGTGLNQYLIILARTGAGKEGAASAIDSLVAAVRPQVPMVDNFVGPSAFASGQALIRILDERPCFVSVLGEFGITLQQMCSGEANAALLMLKKVLLDLYTKSGWTKVLRESAYSDKEKTTKVVQAPNVTILAESVPEKFFEGLDESHIAEGLIPRFSIIEYTGHRVDRNPNAGMPPSKNLVDRFADLVVRGLSTHANGTVCPVQVDPPAQTLLDAFDKEADLRINRAGSDVESQLWNRAHLKALKLGALLAVGVSIDQPIVTAPLAEWSIKFVRRDVETVSTRYRAGDVGKGASKMDNDLRRIIQTYMSSSYDKVKVYGVEEKMWKDKIVPYVYLQRRCANLSAFKADRRGAVGALKETIQSMCDGGVLVELLPQQLRQDYDSRAKAYVIGKAWTPI